MAVQKSRKSKSKKGMRRAHHALSATNVIEDKQTGEIRLPHHVCLKTGTYRGRQVLEVK